MTPQVSAEAEQRDRLLVADRAEESLNRLAPYHCASRDHELLALLWETGVRIAGVKSPNVGDIGLDEWFLAPEHRAGAWTVLKNGSAGERLVAISPEVAGPLGDYIADTRAETTDEYGRTPLLASRQGWPSGATTRRIVYDKTAPCVPDGECPDCTDTPDTNRPEAATPHAIRSGVSPTA